MIADSGCSLVLADAHWSGAAISAAASAGGRAVRLLDSGGADASGPVGVVPQPAQRSGSDTAVILYTSGTTGRPKGAELTVSNMEKCAETFAEVLELSSSDVAATALPLFHVFGQAVVMGSIFRAGSTLAVLPRFEARAMVDLIAEADATMFMGVPTMYNALLALDGDLTDCLSRLRLAASGGASLPEAVLDAFDQRFGCAILEGYGLTETTGAATFNGLHRKRKPGSVGIALPGVDFRVVADDGESTGVGEVGEVLVRGPVVTKGYWGRPDATAEALRNGWLHTGDLGKTDEDGDLYIVDRKKDLIIRGGYNVYPREVEEVLYKHPDIIEVAVVGVADDFYGETVAAAVVKASGSELSAGQVTEWARQRLSPYKVPRLVAFVDALPKGPSGKILKRSVDPRVFG